MLSVWGSPTLPPVRNYRFSKPWGHTVSHYRFSKPWGHTVSHAHIAYWSEPCTWYGY